MSNLSMRLRFLVVCFIATIAFLFSSPAFGKALYVNASTGTDSYTWAQNDSSHPWATLTKAVQAAVAGDTVYVLPGTYTGAGKDSRWLSAFNTKNSGTLGKPITFIGTAGVVLRTDMVPGPIIGAYERDYIVWKNFTVDENNYTYHSDTGPVVLSATTGSVIDNVTVIGKVISGRNAGENPTAIRIEGSFNITIKNSTIYGLHLTSGHHHNVGGIMTYRVNGLVIENNEIYDTDMGIFIKGPPQRNITIRYNYLHDLDSEAILIYEVTNAIVYQNIISHAAMGIVLDFSANHNVVFSNNTIAYVTSTARGEAGGIYGRYAPSGLSTFRNNIVYGGNHSVVWGSYSWPGVFNYNNYYGYSLAGWWLGSDGGGSGQTWGQWRKGIAGDSNSILTDPQFVNPATRNYRLQVGSPARTASDTGGAIGAYITGTEIIGTGSSPPSQRRTR